VNRSELPRRVKVVVDRPVRPLIAFALVVVAALVVGAAGYALGRYQLSGSLALFDSSEVDGLRQHATDLERQLADIQLSQVVDRDAHESLRQTIKSLRDELSASQEEVLFYRQLMAPSEAQRGLRIEKFELNPAQTANEINYRLLLTQVVERHDWASGVVTVDVAGGWDNEQVVLPLTELTKLDSYPLPFRFRYLQDFTGVLAIPDGLTPERVIVTAATSGKQGKRTQRTFNWTLEED
jgi:Family of unknown function (DUF6776)